MNWGLMVYLELRMVSLLRLEILELGWVLASDSRLGRLRLSGLVQLLTRVLAFGLELAWMCKSQSDLAQVFVKETRLVRLRVLGLVLELGRGRVLLSGLGLEQVFELAPV